MITKAYDYNVHASEADVLCLTAYQNRYDEDGFYTTDSEHYHTLRIPLKQGKKAIEFLLGSNWEQFYPFTDYDDWIPSPWEYGRPPLVIRRFMATLPTYEIKEPNGME